MLNLFYLYKKEEDHFTNILFGLLQLMHNHERKMFDTFFHDLVGLSSNINSNAHIKFQVSGEDSRPDALVEDAYRYILFESKIKSGTLKEEQIKNHLKILNRTKKRKKMLILLTPDDSTSGYIKKFIGKNKSITHLQWKKVYDFFASNFAKTKNNVLKELMINFNKAIENRILSQDFAAVILKIDFSSKSGVKKDTYLQELKDGKWKNWPTPREYKQLNGQGRKLLLYDKYKQAVTAEVEIEEVSINKYRKQKKNERYIYNNKFNMESIKVFKRPIPASDIRKIPGFEIFALSNERTGIRNVTRSQYDEIFARK